MTKKIPLKLIVNSVSNEKCISEDIIFDAIKDAIIYTTKKKYGLLNITSKINNKDGTYKTYIIKKITKNPSLIHPIKNPTINIPITNTINNCKNINIGDIIEQEISSINFSRIDAQTAKQVIIQKVHLAERKLIINKFSKKLHTLLSGIIKTITKEYIILDLGDNAEGILKKDTIIPKESFKIGDKIKAYFIDISKQNKGPEFILNRTCEQMLIELFKLEVPEINEDIIKIKNIAREPGVKTKVSVTTCYNKIDPIGACIGIRGSRIQAISNEIDGEKIDIILWDENIVKYIINALSPTEILSIEINEKNRSMNIIVDGNYLSRTIGKNGINVKLASKLTGWNLNISLN